jgi:hypothetical protein
MESPSQDIGFRELDALARTGVDPLQGLVTSSQTTATVELAPLVWTTLNVSTPTPNTSRVRAGRDRQTLSLVVTQLDHLR